MRVNKTAIITGAATGIGRQTALVLAKEGYCVAVHYNKSESGAKTLCESIAGGGGRAFAIKADLIDQKQAQFMVERAKQVFGRIDVLVNNAGAAQQKMFCDITAQDWEYIFAANVNSTFYCCKAALPYMIADKSGSIVNVSSVWGQAGASCEVHYSAAKAAVIGLTRALAKEVGRSGVRVNCVAPGVIDTQMTSCLEEETKRELSMQTPLNRMGSAYETAQAICFLASDKAAYITGQVLSVNGGFYI